MDLIKQINDICNAEQQEIMDWNQYFTQQASLLTEEAFAKNAEILNENSVGILLDRIEMALRKAERNPMLMKNIATVLVSLQKVKQSKMKGPKVTDFLDNASKTDAAMNTAAEQSKKIADTSMTDVEEFIKHIEDKKINPKNVLKDLRAYFVNSNKDPFKYAL